MSEMLSFLVHPFSPYDYLFQRILQWNIVKPNVWGPKYPSWFENILIYQWFSAYVGSMSFFN